MKIIENNYKPQKEYNITCNHCNSKLSFTDEDIRTTALDRYVKCPACFERVYIKNEDTALSPYFKSPYLCSECGTEFNTEPYIGSDGALFARCPKCGNEEWIGEGITLTKDNIEFPQHFYQFGVHEYSAHVNNEKITERVRECIKKINDDTDFSYWMSGDTFVIVFKNEENEVCVIVGTDYYESNVQIL